MSYPKVVDRAGVMTCEFSNFFFMTSGFDKLTRHRRDTARAPGSPINIDAATITQYHSSGTAQFTATFN